MSSTTLDTLPADVARHRVLDTLPPEVARHRVLGTHDACEFVGLSVAEWRKLRRKGQAPSPIMLGTRKQGWRVGDLIDWIASRKQTEAA
jgi:predicted DNA-binding transcriptional regulator AlpA